LERTQSGEQGRRFADEVIDRGHEFRWRRLALLGHQLPQAAKGTQFHFGTTASKLGRVWD
jgi:hypothetical protein